jgi:hypothetical protein
MYYKFIILSVLTWIMSLNFLYNMIHYYTCVTEFWNLPALRKLNHMLLVSFLNSELIAQAIITKTSNFS